MNTAKTILKNTRYGNILYLVGYLGGYSFWVFFFQEILLFHITAIIMSRHEFDVLKFS